MINELAAQKQGYQILMFLIYTIVVVLLGAIMSIPVHMMWKKMMGKNKITV